MPRIRSRTNDNEAWDLTVYPLGDPSAPRLYATIDAPFSDASFGQGLREGPEAQALRKACEEVTSWAALQARTPGSPPLRLELRLRPSGPADSEPPQAPRSRVLRLELTLSRDPDFQGTTLATNALIAGSARTPKF